MSKKIMKRSLALGALMAFVITGSAWAGVSKTDDYTGRLTHTGYNDIASNGAVYSGSGSKTYTLEDFKSNSVKYNKKGGAISWGAGTLTIDNCVFYNNLSNEKGGAVNINGTHLILNGDAAERNFIDSTGKECVVKGNWFEGNIAKMEYGGAIVITTGSSVIDLTGTNIFKNNSSWAGGAIGSEAIYDLNVGGNAIFEGNNATSNGGGGAIYCKNGNSTIDFDCVEAVFKGNTSYNGGGAIYNNGTINFDGGTIKFDSNTVTRSGQRGGAIYNSGKIEFNSGTVTFSNNKANNELNDIHNTGNIEINEGAAVELDGGITGTGVINIVGGTLNGKLTSYISGSSTYANNVTISDGGTWNLQGDSVVKGIEVKGDATINGAKEDGSRSVLSLNNTIDGSRNSPLNYAIEHTDGTLEIQNITLKDINKTGSTNGATMGAVLYSKTDKEEIKILNSNITNNNNDMNFGVMYVEGGNIDIVNSKIANNKTNSIGGALTCSNSTLTIKDDVYEANKAQYGGAIYLFESQMDVDGEVDFSENVASVIGGAIYVDSASINFNGITTFDNNTANGAPNDIYNDGTINVNENSYVTFNSGIDGDGTTNINGGTLELGGNNRIGILKVTDNGKIAFGEKGHLDVDKIDASSDTVTITMAGKDADDLNTKEQLTTVAERMGVAENYKATDKVKVVMTAGEIVGKTTGDVVFEAQGTGADTYYHGVVKNVVEAPNPANEAISDTGISMKLHWRAHVDDMNKRMGELRDANGEHGVWTRMVRGESEYKNTKAQYNQYQLGYDEKLSVDKRWTVGAAVTFSEGDASYGYGSTEDKSTAFAIYGSKLNNDGTFVDLIARYAHLESDVDDQAGKGSYSANGMSVSAEFGKRIQQGNGLWIEPQAELTYGTIDSAEYKLGTKTVEVGDMDSLIGRVGFRIGKDIEKGNVYARASYLYDFEGETENAFRNDTARRSFNEDLGGGWWEVGVGANINLSKATYVYADVEKTFGGEVDTNWQWNLGVRYSF